MVNVTPRAAGRPIDAAEPISPVVVRLSTAGSRLFRWCLI
jgi:hypothetical protein